MRASPSRSVATRRSGGATPFVSVPPRGMGRAFAGGGRGSVHDQIRATGILVALIPPSHTTASIREAVSPVPSTPNERHGSSRGPGDTTPTGLSDVHRPEARALAFKGVSAGGTSARNARRMGSCRGHGARPTTPGGPAPPSPADADQRLTVRVSQREPSHDSTYRGDRAATRRRDEVPERPGGPESGPTGRRPPARTDGMASDRDQGGPGWPIAATSRSSTVAS